MYCYECHKYLERDEQHAFSGYGFFVVYCDEHCPKECDGTECWCKDKEDSD